MSLVQYVPTNTFIHRLDPRTKLVIILFVLALAFTLQSLIALLILMAAILGSWLYVKAPFSYISKTLTVLIVLTIFITLIQGFFYSQRTEFYEKTYSDDTSTTVTGDEVEGEIETIDLIPARFRVGLIAKWFGPSDKPDRAFILYKEGVLFGLTLGLRLGSIISVMPLITMTTPLTDLMLALVKLRVSWTISYIFITSFRFVPLLMSQTDTILNAQKLRGLAVEKANLIKRITAYAPLAIPVILGAFRNSEQLEIVLATRGFTDITNRTSLYEIGWENRDTVAVSVMGFVFVLAIVFRILQVSIFV
jgi:energy-coupling factor transport system permease protein